MREGYEKLWAWFGLSRASWLTMSRALMHEMPDEWQGKMADLLQEWDETYTNWPEDYGTTVRVTLDGKLIKTPSWALNYRHPDREKIGALKKPAGETEQ